MASKSVWEARRFLENQFQSQFGKKFPYSIVFSKMRWFGNGTCGIDLSKPRLKFDFAIGEKDIPVSDVFGRISEDVYVKFLVTGLHELEHGLQYLQGFDDTANAEDVYSLLSLRQNGSYYSLGRNYHANMAQIDAEYGGILALGHVLNNQGHTDTRDILVRYVNARIIDFRTSQAEYEKHLNIFGKPFSEDVKFYFFDQGPDFAGYHDFTEWVTAAKGIREEALRTPLPYPDWMLGYRDEFLDVTARGGPKWSYFLDAFQNAPDQVLQARMMSLVWAWLRPEQAERFAVYREGFLAPEGVFGRSFPERRESVLNRIWDRRYEKPKMAVMAKVPGYEGASERILAEAERMVDETDTEFGLIKI